VTDQLQRYGPSIECSICGDRIRSRHRHDMVWCRCGKTAVDGGAAYLRVLGFPVMKGGTTIRVFPGPKK
jgi:hypothetical protein